MVVVNAAMTAAGRARNAGAWRGRACPSGSSGTAPGACSSHSCGCGPRPSGCSACWPAAATSERGAACWMRGLLGEGCAGERQERGCERGGVSGAERAQVLCVASRAIANEDVRHAFLRCCPVPEHQVPLSLTRKASSATMAVAWRPSVRRAKESRQAEAHSSGTQKLESTASCGTPFSLQISLMARLMSFCPHSSTPTVPGDLSCAASSANAPCRGHQERQAVSTGVTLTRRKSSCSTPTLEQRSSCCRRRPHLHVLLVAAAEHLDHLDALGRPLGDQALVRRQL